MTYCARSFFRLTVITFMLMDSNGAGAQPEKPIPCIDTNPGGLVEQVIQVTRADKPDSPLQFFGKVVSWDPKGRTVGLMSDFSNTVEQLPVRSLDLSFRRPFMAAQMPIPSIDELGPVSQTYVASQVSVDQGILLVPGCTMPSPQDQIRFEGRLAFDKAKMTVKGIFYNIVAPQFGPGADSTGPKGG